MSASRLAVALRAEIAGERAMPGTRLSLASVVDIPSLDALNAKIIARMPANGLFMRQRHDFFDGILGAGGAVIMVHCDGALAGYSVALPVSGAFPPFLEATGADGLLHGTAVDAPWRGRGWQSCLIELRCRALFACGCRMIQATAAPSNHNSVLHLVDAAFDVVALVIMPYGDPRFVLERHERAVPRPDRTVTPLSRELLPPHGALGAHGERLSRGERAVGVGRSPVPALYYCGNETRAGV